MTKFEAQICAELFFGSIKKIWVTCQWSQDDHCLLSIYHYIDGVDWKKDFFDMYGQGYQLPDVIKTFLSTHGGVFKTWPMDRYILDDALSIQIEYVHVSWHFDGKIHDLQTIFI